MRFDRAVSSLRDFLDVQAKLARMRMPMISEDRLQQVVAILGSTAAQDVAMEAKVLELVGDKILAQRLLDWIPEVFGLVLVSHIGNVNPPRTFSAKSSEGHWVEISLDAEPIFKAVVPIAMAMFHSGPKDAFRCIAQRSAILDTANNALNAGASLDGATLSGPALMSIPAEVYAKQSQSFWHRLFR
jgi:hypothetical protein